MKILICRLFTYLHICRCFRTSFTDENATEPINVVTVAFRIEDGMKDDMILSEKCQEFCYQNRLMLLEKGIRRVTFMALEARNFPKYFTFR